MKNFMLLLATIVFSINQMKAQDFTISFAASGASTNVDNVIVQNITQGTSLTISNGDQLKLTSIITGINSSKVNSKGMNIYPNPSKGNCFVEFDETKRGSSTILISDVSGKTILKHDQLTQDGRNKFKVSGLTNGMYSISIISGNRILSDKIICVKSNTRSSSIIYEGYASNPIDVAKFRNAQTVQQMLYKKGDQLLFRGSSGIYTNIVTDIPDTSKTITFNFTNCRDADGNNYATVKIGAQTWMAENLRSTKYRNGNQIPLITDKISWGYLIAYGTRPGFCWLYDDIANKNRYGGLYNWYAISTSEISPTGWHVPTDAEWTLFENYLIANGYNFDKTITNNKIAKSIATSDGYWNSYDQISTWIGIIPNDPNKNNKSGFSALPCRYRSSDGNFISAILDSQETNWWSTSTGDYDGVAWSRSISNNSQGTQRVAREKNYGYGIRCIKD